MARSIFFVTIAVLFVYFACPAKSSKTIDILFDEQNKTFVNAKIYTKDGRITADVVRLYPGWMGILKAPINQTLVPTNVLSGFKPANVTLYPGWSLVHGHNTTYATKDSVGEPHYTETFTIAFPDQEKKNNAAVTANGTRTVLMHLQKGNPYFTESSGEIAIPSGLLISISDTNLKAAFVFEQSDLSRYENLTLKLELSIV